MRTGYTGYVSPSEWRWVIILSSIFVLAALFPFLWVAFNDPASSQQRFMGALHDYPNTASYLARMIEGSQGAWLGHYLHTPEPHHGVLVDGVYILLGQLSMLTRIPVIVLFHVARIGAAFFMYAAIYFLGARIWMRVRSRRVFFVLAVCGSGLGWLLAPLTNSPNYIDLLHPELYPFYTTLTNVHLPLAMGGMAILISAIIEVLRPGTDESPMLGNEGGTIFFFSLFVTFLYPPGIVPIGIAFVVVLLARMLQNRGTPYGLRWMLCLIVPPLPLLAYYGLIFAYNPVVSQIWLNLNRSMLPPVWIFALGLGIPLVIALPGLYRAIRRFEQDGNQIMLLWLLATVLLIYLTPVIQLDFGLGLMLVMAYFGTRSAEDYWFRRFPRKWRYQMLIVVAAGISLSFLVVLMTPMYAFRSAAVRAGSSLVLESDYDRLFQWLRLRPGQEGVVLAAPQVGLWLPAWSGRPVVYGSREYTLNAEQKGKAVADWYRDGQQGNCDALLNGRYSAYGRYQVLYVVYGPREKALGDAPCLAQLERLVMFGSVELYVVNRTTEAD